MATGSEQTTSGNVKALWAHLWGGVPFARSARPWA